MITILCSGTRGDVQPYLALAQQLNALGLPVRIAANRDFESFVRGYGLDFHPVAVDFASAGVDPEMVRQAQRADNLFKMVGSFQKMKAYGVHMVEAYHDACLGSDALVYHPGLTIGHFMAQRLGIPSVLASPFPLHRTSERPSVVLYGKVPNWASVSRLSYSALQGMLWMASEASLVPFWKQKYGKLPAGFGQPFEKTDQGHPAVVSCSEFVFPRPRDWSPDVHQNGYWFVEEPAEYQPSPELAAFLAAGDKPVYVGFGSMFDKGDTETVGRTVVEGLKLAGRRAVVNGMSGLTLTEGMLAVDGVPHSWLFPRMAAVCHHGGAGTTAAGFRAGVPSVIVPFALDQFAWAQRSFELGVGSPPLPVKKLTASRLAEACRFAIQPQVVAAAAELGAKLARENGARDAAKVIAGVV
jgi:sterol 3beta-glucosyltransferase